MPPPASLRRRSHYLAARVQRVASRPGRDRARRHGEVQFIARRATSPSVTNGDACIKVGAVVAPVPTTSVFRVRLAVFSALMLPQHVNSVCGSAAVTAVATRCCNRISSSPPMARTALDPGRLERIATRSATAEKPGIHQVLQHLQTLRLHDAEQARRLG